MSKVIFCAEKKSYAVSYEHLFKCGTDITALGGRFRPKEDVRYDEKGSFYFPSIPQDREHFIGSEDEWEILQAQPDWRNVGRSYIFALGEGGCVGVEYMRCLFCEGKEHNQLTLQDARDISDMRAYIENKEGFIEVSCDKEAAMLGGGCQSTGGDHEQHKKELQEKYGDGNTDPELGNWDLKMQDRLKK